MKKCILFLCLSFIFLSGKTQFSLSFCETISDDGSPQNTSVSFSRHNDSSVLKFYITADGKLETPGLDFVIYYVNNDGNEEQLIKVVQKTEPEWNYAWKEVVLFTPGTYRIKIYNANGTYLTSANVNIKQ